MRQDFAALDQERYGEKCFGPNVELFKEIKLKFFDWAIGCLLIFPLQKHYFFMNVYDNANVLLEMVIFLWFLGSWNLNYIKIGI